MKKLLSIVMFSMCFSVYGGTLILSPGGGVYSSENFGFSPRSMSFSFNMPYLSYGRLDDSPLLSFMRDPHGSMPSFELNASFSSRAGARGIVMDFGDTFFSLAMGPSPMAYLTQDLGPVSLLFSYEKSMGENQGVIGKWKDRLDRNIFTLGFQLKHGNMFELYELISHSPEYRTEGYHRFRFRHEGLSLGYALGSTGACRKNTEFSCFLEARNDSGYVKVKIKRGSPSSRPDTYREEEREVSMKLDLGYFFLTRRIATKLEHDGKRRVLHSWTLDFDVFEISYSDALHFSMKNVYGCRLGIDSRGTYVSYERKGLYVKLRESGSFDFKVSVEIP